MPDGSELFVSAEAKATITKTDLQTVARISGYGNYASLIKYDVSFYNFTYKTQYKDSEIEAYGLLTIPQNTPAPPALLSAQHGTVFADAEAPSNFPATFTRFELFAAGGYVTLIPDYIGYRASKDKFHPYYDKEHSALAVVDMIKAANYYLRQEQIAISNSLFLTDYSEDGYVTMSAQKEIETNPAHKLTLTAAASGTGGYD